MYGADYPDSYLINLTHPWKEGVVLRQLGSPLTYFMQVVIFFCSNREDVSNGNKVVGPAGGTLLFLLTLNV